ncbi:MAG: DUF2812 domain-containing protein [Oscillospiraceae bacterium]|nr:DUF2812 domain-containing protein [Oscillospiraceae bacterium]
MARKTKRSWKAYAAWDYHKEIEDLNKASEQGWQLTKGGCFSSKFVKNPDVRYRYQMDFRKVSEMGRYIETFREQGWEYVSSTFNGWHFFRKLYDPALPEAAYEIFTDRESLREMHRRWARVALIIGAVVAAFALFCAVRMVRMPNLPTLLLLLVSAFEAVFLLWGGFLMRRSDVDQRRQSGIPSIAVFLAVVFLGSAGNLTLTGLRPHFVTVTAAESVTEAVQNESWAGFQVRYPDCYYLNLDIEAAEPLTFSILDEAGDTVYQATETVLHRKDIPLRLARGEYALAISCTSGYRLRCGME